MWSYSIGLLAIAWAYWPTLILCYDRWSTDPQYSHGFFVPLFSFFLLYWNRSPSSISLKPSWWGLVSASLAVGLLYAGYIYYLNWLDGLSLLVALAGFSLILGGGPMFRWSIPSVLFLVFMLPLPFRMQSMLGEQLQTLATGLSVFTLQTIGISAVAEGNVILLSTTRLGIVEACSGLSMLMTFAAFTAGFALLVRRDWLDRLIILFSAIPISIIANVIRITVTAVLYESGYQRMAALVFHDLAGWLMMPLALCLLFLLLRLLDCFFLPSTSEDELIEGNLVPQPT